MNLWPAIRMSEAIRRAERKERELVMDDQRMIEEYLEIAKMHKEKEHSTFGYGLYIGRALEHAEQNAVDPEWLVEAFNDAGLPDDAALVSVPKLAVGRG